MSLALDIDGGKTRLTLGCESNHGQSVTETFRCANYVEAYAAAMRAGWKETYINDARCFLCPRCSGKTGGVASLLAAGGVFA